MRKKTESAEVGLSRALSYVLRHSAKDLGLELTSEGYVSVEKLLNLDAIKKHNATLAMVKKVVETNDKKRFELSPDGTMIRATQGHTIEEVKEEGLMKTITDASEYPLVVHGNYSEFWSSIYTKGLRKMERNHIR